MRSTIASRGPADKGALYPGGPGTNTVPDPPGALWRNYFSSTIFFTST